jgi:hypothetical protein
MKLSAYLLVHIDLRVCRVGSVSSDAFCRRFDADKLPAERRSSHCSTWEGTNRRRHTHVLLVFTRLPGAGAAEGGEHF